MDPGTGKLATAEFQKWSQYLVYMYILFHVLFTEELAPTCTYICTYTVDTYSWYI